jgi:hypothetical protein
MHGLVFAFTFSLILNLLAAAASWLGGAKFIHVDREETGLGPQPAE